MIDVSPRRSIIRRHLRRRARNLAHGDYDRVERRIQHSLMAFARQRRESN